MLHHTEMKTWLSIRTWFINDKALFSSRLWALSSVTLKSPKLYLHIPCWKGLLKLWLSFYGQELRCSKNSCLRWRIHTFYLNFSFYLNKHWTLRSSVRAELPKLSQEFQLVTVFWIWAILVWLLLIVQAEVTDFSRNQKGEMKVLTQLLLPASEIPDSVLSHLYNWEFFSFNGKLNSTIKLGNWSLQNGDGVLCV